MKLTRRYLRRLIIETMTLPSVDVINQILDDPEVDEKLKVLLGSDDEENIAMGFNLLSTIYPEKYGFLDNIDVRTATTAYENEYSATQHSHEVAA